MAKKPETLFKERCKKQVDALSQGGGRIWCFHPQMVAVLGIPDLIMCIDGQFWAVELKRNDKLGPSPLQRYILGLIRKAGGEAHTVGPDGWFKLFPKIHNAAMRML